MVRWGVEVSGDVNIIGMSRFPNMTSDVGGNRLF